MSDEIGFREVPWRKQPTEDVLDLPPDENDESSENDETICSTTWDGWACTRAHAHPGTHRAGTGRYIVAEWWSE